MTKLVAKLHSIFRNRIYWLRGWLLKYYLALHGCKVGKSLRCVEWPYFRSVPNNNIFIGNFVTIGRNVTLQSSKNGRIILKDYVKLTQDNLISAASEVHIGNHSGLAEYVSIRDSDHGIAKGETMWSQPMVSEPIRIGNDVQISRGCAVFRGVTIEDGVIIGAHSIVTRNIKTVKNGIYLGSPLKLIGKRM